MPGPEPRDIERRLRSPELPPDEDTIGRALTRIAAALEQQRWNRYAPAVQARDEVPTWAVLLLRAYLTSQPLDFEGAYVPPVIQEILKGKLL